MIIPSDKEYKQTKLILRGESKINPDFEGLARWIDNKYGVNPLNIIYDTVDNGKLPRIEIIFEFDKERRKFELSSYVYDEKKQTAIASQFKNELIDKGYVAKGFSLNKSKYQADNLIVIFSAFEPISMIETDSLIPQSEIDKLKTEINSPDLWEISRSTGGPTFFLYTDKQVVELEKTDFKQRWHKLYFDLLKKYDEFDYFNFDKFSISLDSKENFDKNFQGNWFFYYR